MELTRIHEEDIFKEFDTPFNLNSLKGIRINIDYLSEKVCFSAIVQFRNNNSSGFHNLEAENLSLLMEKVNSFINSMKEL